MRLLDAEGHAVRATTRTQERREQIEATGAECFIGDPDRLATLRPALDGVTIACWLLSCVSGPDDQVKALHGSRLEFFLSQIIDTPVRGFVYEAHPGVLDELTSAAAIKTVREMTSRNSIPLALIQTDPADRAGWEIDAHAAISSLLR
jgi:hypothetical protein